MAMDADDHKQPMLDGSGIFHLVENTEAFSKFVDAKFSALDISPRDGRLSRQELQPAVSELGVILGMPPRGSEPESDHIYEEILAEFFKGRKKEDTISKEEFASTLRDVLLGVADGLKRKPISVVRMDGAELRMYVDSPGFEVDAVALFSQLDSNSDGEIDGTKLQKLLRSKTSLQQILPSGYEEACKGLSEMAMRKAGVSLSNRLNQTEFIDVLRQILLAIACMLEEKPLSVAYTESNYDGIAIANFLRDKQAVKTVLGEIWDALRKDGKGNVTPDCLIFGLDTVAPAAGLPPMGVVDEMDKVYQDSLKVADESRQGLMNKENFEKCLLEILGSLMLQLQGKPINIKTSSVVDDQGRSDFFSNK